MRSGSPTTPTLVVPSAKGMIQTQYSEFQRMVMSPSSAPRLRTTRSKWAKRAVFARPGMGRRRPSSRARRRPCTVHHETRAQGLPVASEKQVTLLVSGLREHEMRGPLGHEAALLQGLFQAHLVAQVQRQQAAGIPDLEARSLFPVDHDHGALLRREQVGERAAGGSSPDDEHIGIRLQSSSSLRSGRPERVALEVPVRTEKGPFHPALRRPATPRAAPGNGLASGDLGVARTSGKAAPPRSGAPR